MALYESCRQIQCRGILNIVSKKHQEKTPKEETEGVISLNTRGTGYLSVQDTENDIEIKREFLNTALNGDRVLVRMKGEKQKGRQQGAVVLVLSRARKEFVGVLEKKNGDYLLKPDDRKVYVDIFIPKSKSKGFKYKPGIKVLSRITDWKRPNENPRGEVLRILGPKGSNEVEMQALIFEHGFDPTFPAKIAEEAKKIERSERTPKSEIQRRRDFRSVTTFTIDPSDAKDFDDALSFRTLKNGNVEVGIHIADVSYYVQPGSDIDKEAQKRGTSSPHTLR